MSTESPALDDWAPLVRGLRTRFRTRDFATGLDLVTAFAAAAEEANHHPDITLTYGHVDVLLYSHDAGRVTDRDRTLAATFSTIARKRSVAAEPRELSIVELGLDTVDAAAIAPFWAAVLRMDITTNGWEGTEIRGHGADAALWFQQTEPHETPRQRFHLDVWIDPREAQERIAAALAAGGRLVTDAHAPSFWVLADAQGNHACICTVTGRS
ncbi:Putative pterin-4-alpha-carbinolamine dehydratase OS=Tsukamurella paurometabola (strain ATCC 8368/ DSM / CCUG 35730 / CIP 100753 / JCM 10117 / KCTC 9821/ NBRC 16120 / NCIMB 702349 / NCTC 13040) OX=521096 GN=Tpau_0882 PE=3 SV=1 [Tsukamurella paurometabola]|uniref:Putative pterin-4-alpha-carbinolamine dehydratase n=1 Tax=Tsukamurella paurometabola (strain ATCC 8368 / DSM 20162 / CCUG 35730 / CIP 100753 / JCM 10117 / KCTC 9821 / NBRC 16120 / NCIMB 702349 / NCTC 13040) TaxID=521096 RepID=D5UUE5_TSUPD|nr:4a-hydroxytetrahydrobiopterin dehydratase [Tsukamurella paurometabola]ADG77516.1 pterin-4-alpha-carbinolamine dehydratase [Tsukamurella paurometabola DSM 20162]SUP27526.1 Putative pterin-4-alpha-carbinolamine dehydratase [Tsukamurella paurometabola]